METLSLELRTRRDAGSGVCRYFDFVVSGTSLFEKVGEQYDFVGLFGDVYYRKHQENLRQQLLLEAPSELGGEWVPLYVCGECGDSGCGLVSVKIVESGDVVTWSDFRYEDENHPHAVNWEWHEPINDVGPYEFNLGAYRHALMSLEFTI